MTARPTAALRRALRSTTLAVDATAAERALSIGAWATRHFRHPRGAGPAAHDPQVTPYWNHWLDLARARLLGEPLAHDPHATACERIFLVSGTQMGKTMGLLMVLLAWIVAVAPRATGLVYPRIDDLKKSQRVRARPAFELSERLRDLLPKGQAQLEKALGQRLWQFRHSVLHWLNGGAGGDLRMLDLPCILMDEYDTFADNINGEGDPIRLLLDRQKTYPLERLLLGITTPTTVSAHGWRRLCSGSHERLLIACPDCAAHDWLNPRQLRTTPETDAAAVLRDDAARWVCAHCGILLDTAAIRRAVRAACAVPGWSPAGGWCPGIWTPSDAPGGGAWLPAAARDARGRIAVVEPPATITRSGWINSLYSPFITLGEFAAAERDAALSSAAARTAFINGWSAEPDAAERDAVTVTDLQHLATGDDWPHGTGPAPVQYLVCAFDQQGQTAETSWFPYVVRGYAADGTSWLVEAGKCQGFAACDDLLKKPFVCGSQIAVCNLVCMDAANGSMTRDVRQWCAQEPRRRYSLSMSANMSPDTTHATQYLNAKNAHILCGLPTTYAANAHLFRDVLMARIRGVPGQPRWRVPTTAPAWYRDSLTSEERVPGKVRIKGRIVDGYIWRPRRIALPSGQFRDRTDNHWWDCEVMQTAITTIILPQLTAPKPTE